MFLEGHKAAFIDSFALIAATPLAIVGALKVNLLARIADTALVEIRALGDAKSFGRLES
jgi:hypothetical protein